MSRSEPVTLSLNSGSSSFKLGLYRISAEPELLAKGAAERQGDDGFRLALKGPGGDRVYDGSVAAQRQPEALREALRTMEELGLPAPDAVGHRIVHGGAKLRAPRLASDQVLAELRGLIPLAPLHLPVAIDLIEAVAALAPATPQVVCFDTAFHRDIPETVQRLPLPRRLWNEGVRRYGFHGLSYESVLRTLGPAARERIIIAHLGSGASLAAVLRGKAVDTTMGMTPTGGLMMGTRCGDIDPGAILYLLRNKKLSHDDLDRLVNHESGLLGSSGRTADMKALLELRAGDEAAREAVALFCHIARKHIGAMAASLGGVDQLVFTGAMGERSPEIRGEICEGLGFLGVRLDADANRRGAPEIHQVGAACEVRIVPTEEERRIAELTAEVVWPGLSFPPASGDNRPQP